MVRKIHIDTDIGTDVDDRFALVYALKNPDLEVASISTVYGDAKKRAMIAKRVTKLLGKDIDVYAGEDLPLDGSKPFTTGFEGDGEILDRNIGQGYINDILRKRMQRPNMNIACIAPLTNIGKALLENVPKSRFYVMGKPPELALEGEKLAHNFTADYSSAKIFSEFAKEPYVITTDIAKRTSITLDEVLKIKTGSEELDNSIYTNARNWAKFSRYGEMFYLYDPLTIAAIAKPDLVKFEQKKGFWVSTDVDSDAFKQHFLEVLQS